MYNADDDYRLMLGKLKAICREKNISQYALAQKAGMSTSSISYLMRGETQPYIGTLLMICNALGVTLNDLLDMPAQEGELCAADDEERLLSCYRELSEQKTGDGAHICGHAPAVR